MTVYSLVWIETQARQLRGKCTYLTAILAALIYSGFGLVNHVKSGAICPHSYVMYVSDAPPWLLGLDSEKISFRSYVKFKGSSFKPRLEHWL